MTGSPRIPPFILVNLETGEAIEEHFYVARCDPRYCGFSQHDREDPKYVIAQVIE